MSDGNSQDPFSERIKRIEERKQREREANPNYTDPAAVSRRSGGGAASRLPIIVFGGGVLVLLIGLAVLVSILKGEPAESVAQADPSLPATPTAAASVGSDAPLPVEDNPFFAPPKLRVATSADPRVSGRDGYAFGPGYATTATNEAVALNAIVAGFQPTGPNTGLGEIVPFEMNTECTLRPVGAGEKLVNVNITRSVQYAPVQTFDDADVLKTLLDVSKEKLDEGEPFDNLKIARGAMQSVDVIVTDTEAPLYLVLQALSSKVLWNITAAPGVEIAHVTMLSSGDAAVAGLPEDTTFEALASSDFTTNTDFYYFKGEADELDCMLHPYPAPKDYWGASIGAQEGNTMDGNFLFSWTNGFEVYSHWYRELLGEGPEVNLITAAEASGALVGDIPAEPLAFIPLAEKRIHVPVHDRILTGTATEREAETQQIYEAVLLPAVGGDPSEVIPTPSEFALPDPANPPVETKVENQATGLLARLAFPDGVQPKLTLRQINRERRVSFSVSMMLEDLLAEGEAMPPEELHQLYMYMRVPRYMQRYCEDTLPAVASTCGVFKTTVHRGKDSYQVRSDFGYIPNYTIGPVARVRGGGFMSAFLPDTNLENTHQTAEERQAFLARLLRVCDRLRSEFGNCLVGTAGFYLDKPARFSGSGANANAAGWVEAYALENPLEARKFQERADAIYAEIIGE